MNDDVTAQQATNSKLKARNDPARSREIDVLSGGPGSDRARARGNELEVTTRLGETFYRSGAGCVETPAGPRGQLPEQSINRPSGITSAAATFPGVCAVWRQQPVLAARMLEAECVRQYLSTGNKTILRTRGRSPTPVGERARAAGGDCRQPWRDLLSPAAALATRPQITVVDACRY